MADVKTLLKDARKLIDDKNYKDAQECCKNILRKDKQNYLALVLLGKSLQDSDQAPLAYQKAIANKPEHPLAWQGLANYYEVKEENRKLLSVYMEILLLHIEEEKALEVIIKIGHIGRTLKSSDAINSLIQYLGKSPDKKVMEAAEKQLLELLKAEVPCSQGDIQLVLTWLLNLYERDPTDSLEILYGKIMLQRDDHLSAVEDIIKSKFFFGNVVLRELVCKFLCNKFVEMNSFGNFPIEQYIDHITEGIENSKYPGLLRSMKCYNNSLYLEAYKQCVPLVNYHQADVTESVFIINCSINLKKWAITQKLASNFLIKAKDQVFINKLKKFLFLALSKQQKWKHAIAAIKDLDIDTLNTSDLVNLAECYIEIEKPAGQVLEKLKSTEHYKQLQALLLLKEGKFEEIIKLLTDQVDNALNCFYLGRAYLELEQHDKAMINLLKAAKLNPEHPYTFLYLGHFYKIHKGDYEKAKRCYEKAYSLNNIDNEIARSLSEIYSKMGMKEADFELLNELEKNIQIKDSWISFKLGLHYLNRREWDNSITHFRNVIKINKNNLVAFECLADAYYSRGSYTSALRAYDKVMTTDPTRSPHCLTRMGYIYSLLTQYEQSISTFEKVINIVPLSLLALKGIGETWMKIAKKKVGAKIFGTARDCAQNAVNYTMKALVEYPQYFSIWKLLADTLMFITKLPNKYAYVHMKDLIKDKTDNKIVRREKLDIFPQAIACYSHIAKQRQQSTSYDLASAYLDFYCETKSPINYQISFKLVLACIKDKPTLWRNWNLLGKICLYIKKYDVAQHCFIKALLVTRKWSVAKIWCNLGTLYLKLNLFKLANYCFWRGQSTLPSYPHSWIGQGLIAEVIREEEAMDLFRHASRLGYHPESALGYADWVCRMLKNGNYKADMELKYVIDGLYAIPYAIDLVEWYHCFEPENACACTILGILQERSGLLRSAYKSYEKALRFAQEEHKNIALLNIGRILIRMEKYDEAIKVHKSVTEASLNSTCGLALALYKKGLYEESYSAYDTALHWLSNSDDEKADLLVAMAGIVYMFKGADEAKTLLFHSIQISQNKPTAYSLFAICSLGLIHSDQNLSKLALSELKKYERDYNYGFDIGFLKSYIHVSEKEMDRAIKILSDSLHDHPNNAMLWFCMAQYCLKTSSAKRRTASCCAQKALCSVYNCDIDDHNPGKILATASIAEHISGNSSKAILLAKKGLHLYPNEGEIWAALLFSLSSNKEWIKRKKWLVSAAEYMRNHLTISRPLGKWVSYMEKNILV